VIIAKIERGQFRVFIQPQPADNRFFIGAQ
jgi:hypothetical protein